MPWNENALERLNQRIKDDSNRREQEYRRKGERGIKLLIGDNDEIAQAAVAADKLPDDRSNDGERDGNLHSAEDFRQRGRNAEFPECLPAARLQRAAEIQELGLDRGEAGGAVDDDREESDEEGDNNLWKQTIAEPDEQQRSDRYFGHQLS